MKEMCEACEGKGKFLVECRKCYGKGKVDVYKDGRYYGESTSCNECRGTGKVAKVCNLCNGKGEITLNDLARLIAQAHKETVERIKEPKCRACDDTGMVTEYSAEGPEGSYSCSCSAGSRYR